MATEQQFCLKWNNHRSTLFSVFDTLLEEESLVDVTLSAEGQFLRAHRVILSACSPYFRVRHFFNFFRCHLNTIALQNFVIYMYDIYRDIQIYIDKIGVIFDHLITHTWLTF